MKDPNSTSSTEAKKNKRSLGQRVGDGARLVGEIGDDLVHRPGVLPGKAHGWFRTWFRKVWKVRGGGLYALGYAVSFAWLEVVAIVEDVAEADSVASFFTSELFEFFFRFLSESLMNMIKAFMWPVWFVEFRPPLGLVALVAAFILFPIVLKKPIERWLFGDEVTGAEDTKGSE